MINTILILFLLLQAKHLIIDWFLQPPYMWQNKGTWMHPGGLLHAGLNALGTTACFVVLDPQPMTYVAIFLTDFWLHYIIDFTKMNINRIMKWGPTTHPEFWWLTGFDQYLHQVTYIFITWLTLGVIGA